MKRHVLNVSLATLGLGALLGSQALAVGPALDSNHSAWDENAYYNGFGGSLPAGIVEGSAGFSTIGDYSGRTIPLAGPDITTNKTDSTVLTTINTGLFSGTDANLYGFQITNPSTFSASLTSTSLILVLFNSSGTALEAAVGGTTDSDTITAAGAGVTSPGFYYIGIADPTEYPENAEGQNIFGLSGSTGTFTPVVSDAVLSTNVATSWTTALTNTSFLAPSSTITLAGSNFAVVPEPTSIALLGTLSLGLLGRRRKLAR